MKIHILLPIIVISCMLSGACGTIQPLTIEQSVDTIMSEFNSPNVPGAAVLVVSHDSVIFKKAYGLASINSHTSVTTSTNFRLASITKQFTAMCILLLQEQGKLSIDDKVTTFFPDFPRYGKDITVRHLLNHTSGLFDYESLIPDSQTIQVLDGDCLRLMYQTDSLYFPAGTKYRYSNTGYAVLSLIVEKISQKRFADFLNENIFDKIGMTATVAFENGISSVSNRAYGHSFADGKWIETDQSVTSAVLGDGGIYSNVEDISKWISALWGYKLIPEKTQRLTWSDATLNNGTPIDYGMGWHKETFHGIKHPHHAGSSRGFRNHLLLFPDEKSMVIILTNRDQGDPIIEAKRIADLLLTIH